MTNSEILAGTVIYRYIIDHGLSEGERLPNPDHLAALLGREVEVMESALDAAQQAGVLMRDSTGAFVVQSLPEIPGQEWLSFSHSATLHHEQVETIIQEARLRPPLADEEDPITTGFEQEAHESLGLKEGKNFIVISRVFNAHGN